MATNTQSDKASLSIRYIRELRGMLAEGRNFRDWTWAQQTMGEGRTGGDWFVVDPKLIDLKDPDCVARQRTTSQHEKETKGYPAEVWELWSPVRAVALYIKLELPLRTLQVRMLDSGEADTWRYADGDWVLNLNRLAQGSERRPVQQGVFRRSTALTDGDAVSTVLYINTNKTADITTSGPEKGYVLPWSFGGPLHQDAFYWFEKLRNW